MESSQIEPTQCQVFGENLPLDQQVEEILIWAVDQITRSKVLVVCDHLEQLFEPLSFSYCIPVVRHDNIPGIIEFKHATSDSIEPLNVKHL